MTPHTPEFEADLEPDTGVPRMRFNFANGWSASIVLGYRTGTTGCEFMMASVAAAPTGCWNQGRTELLGTECHSDEAVAMLAEVASRPKLEGAPS